MAGGIVGGVIAGGARQIASGKRPSLGDLLMTPANALRVTNQLAQLRGAAMKLGQLVSMDAGEFVPPELADILARLRSDAQPMPRAQLAATLGMQWGRDWRARFEHFDEQPIAAASIGQVHRARTTDGRDLAIKVQYPGVRTSIDSDVNNVASLMKLSGLLPPTLDLAPLLTEAKRQLHDEADYLREAAYLTRYDAHLAGAPGYVLPVAQADLTRRGILAMTYVAGVPIETLEGVPQAERDRVATLLIDLTLRELFDFGLMQSDPNFANYRYDGAQVVLLDFGAARDLGPGVADRYRALARAVLAGEREATRRAMIDVGLFDARVPAAQQAIILDMAQQATAPLRLDGWFDFADMSVVARLRDQGMALATDRALWHAPPIDTLFVQRKLGGMYLLATRLRARVDVGGLLGRYL